MISETMQEAINDQINREFYAAFLYLGMSAQLDAKNLTGMARWMRAQYEEELGHGLKLLDFVTDRGGEVKMKAVQAPPNTYKSPLSCFEAALEHERKVTGDLSKLYEQAWREKDHSAHSLLEWFMEEQVEEEKMVEEIVDKLRLAGDNGAALLMMEAELGKRNGATAGPSASSPS
ncbi:MAG: ferritin [Chloroflexi bacterium]|nr:ferritin [Chloroflexota bacterium]